MEAALSGMGPRGLCTPLQLGQREGMSWLMDVKNTFIDIRESQLEESHRRSHSSPASSRASTSLPDLGCSPAASSQIESSENESLDGGSTEENSETSEASTLYAKSDRSAAKDWDVQDGLGSVEPLLKILAPQMTSRHNVNCDVQPRRPPGPPNLPALPDFFMQHTGQVVMAAAATLAASAHPVIDVHTTRDRKGWSIVAKLRPEDLGHTDQVVEWAKEAILQAALDSVCVYVMGYRRGGFRHRPHGFGAMLGLMQDEHLACWDVYNTGCCKREDACHWRHPASVKRLYFVVKPLVPEGADPWACFRELELEPAAAQLQGSDASDEQRGPPVASSGPDTRGD